MRHVQTRAHVFSTRNAIRYEILFCCNSDDRRIAAVSQHEMGEHGSKFP